jgi:hypothetical protein
MSTGFMRAHARLLNTDTTQEITPMSQRQQDYIISSGLALKDMEKNGEKDSELYIKLQSQREALIAEQATKLRPKL